MARKLRRWGTSSVANSWLRRGGASFKLRGTKRGPEVQAGAIGPRVHLLSSAISPATQPDNQG